MPKKPEEEKQIEIKMRPTLELSTTRIYSNFAEISHSPYDFTIRFCDATPITDYGKLEEAKGVHDIPVVAEIAVPHEVIPALINALTTQYKNFQEAIGAGNGKKTSKKSGKK
ncbi:MAG: DUF3467 domain-containing protein [Desulfobacteraceae bacterium]|nr:DUF3467 domain-containing protein [Desulfobacteraceae bacterium]